MAENSGSSGTPMLAFIVGGLVVVVAVIAFFMYSGGMPSGDAKSVDVKIEAPSLPDAPKLPDAPIPTPK